MDVHPPKYSMVVVSYISIQALLLKKTMRRPQAEKLLPRNLYTIRKAAYYSSCARLRKNCFDAVCSAARKKQPSGGRLLR